MSTYSIRIQGNDSYLLYITYTRITMITMKTMMITIVVAANVPELMEPSLC